MAATGPMPAVVDGRRDPALDGLRGVAVALVLVGHAHVPHLVNAASVGVTLFFTLSGYLITSLLVRDRARHGRVRFRSFYLRRARRLLPPLVVMLVVVTALNSGRHLPNRDMVVADLAALFYVANFTSWLGIGADVLDHTWTLAVEEQFYLVWPVVIALAPRRWLLRICLVGVGLSLTLRLLLSGVDVSQAYLGTHTNAWALLGGAALALRPINPARGTRVVAWLVLLGCCFLPPITQLSVAAAPVLAWACVVLVASAGATLPLRVVGLRYLGVISYSVYLWSFPLTWQWPAYYLPGQWQFVTGAVLGVAAAAVSWQFLESRILGTTRFVVRSERTSRGRSWRFSTEDDDYRQSGSPGETPLHSGSRMQP